MTDDEAYEAHCQAELEAMCPKVRELTGGFDDPITVHYGAQDVIADAITRHSRTCEHAWCVSDSGRDEPDWGPSLSVVGASTSYEDYLRRLAELT